MGSRQKKKMPIWIQHLLKKQFLQKKPPKMSLKSRTGGLRAAVDPALQLLQPGNSNRGWGSVPHTPKTSPARSEQ